MLRYLNNRRAQALIGEYVLVIFLVMATISAMTIYFKRGMQARIYDARDYMINDVRVRTQGSYFGNLYLEYEPYYINTDATITRDIDYTTTLLPGASSGIFKKTISESTGVEVSSETAPPRDGN